MPRLRTKGPKKGLCNICGENKNLTEDHVPPKGVLKMRNVMLSQLATYGQNKKSRQFQQGVKFRSLCESCNSELLGSLYDPALVSLCNKVTNYLQANFALPSSTTFDSQPSLIIRSILGHILALGVLREPVGELYELAADLVLNPDMIIPNDLKVFYWLYPYQHQVSIRGCGITTHLGNGNPPLFAAVLKFIPLAFMIVYKPDPGYQFPHYNLVDYVALGNNQIPLDFKKNNLPPRDYPELPDEAGAGAGSSLAWRRFVYRGA